MILISDLINEYSEQLHRRYKTQLMPDHHHALTALKHCRTNDTLFIQAQCQCCLQRAQYPHSCGHRSCPHCQHHECEQWLARQRAKLLPVNYFMITFTLPAELRSTVWQHQYLIYDLLLKLSWETLRSFGLNDKKLQGKLGATSVLHTNTRSLDYHPHVHIVVPGGALDEKHRLWRKKKGKYLFNQKNMACVFRAKCLAALKEHGLVIKDTLPEKWIVDCRDVGRGDKAIIYLGKYLYRGVIMEKNIIRNHNGYVTFGYTDNKNQPQTRTLKGADFLWLLLRHVLPKGFRRTRDYGLLHPNSKRLIKIIQLVFNFMAPPVTKKKKPGIACPHCGGIMQILAVKQLRQINPIISQKAWVT